MFNKSHLLSYLNSCLNIDNLVLIRKELTIALNKLNQNDNLIELENDVEFLQAELQQILATQTIERTKYYIKRLVKSLTLIKTSKINDINLNKWKQYDDILTDSLWVIEKRDNSGAHNASYWGNFIPQIPNQFLKRYTKKGDWVLDTFLGSGTTLIECVKLGRNGIGVELQPSVIELAKNNIENEVNKFNVETKIINADCTDIDYSKELSKIGIKSVQLLIIHPPYWDIIKFSEDNKDLSNAKSLDSFLKMMEQLAIKTHKVLDNNRYCALIISDKYVNGEWIPLAFYTMQQFLKNGYALKSTIVKNFEETKGKMNKKELWRYRALVGGFYIFKHEYIFVFKKEKRLK